MIDLFVFLRVDRELYGDDRSITRVVEISNGNFYLALSVMAVYRLGVCLVCLPN